MKDRVLKLLVFTLLSGIMLCGCAPSEEDIFINNLCKEWRVFSIEQSDGKIMPASIRTRSSTVAFQKDGIALSHEKQGTKSGKWTIDKSTGSSVIVITDDSTQKSYELQIELLTDSTLQVSQADSRYPNSGKRTNMYMRPFDHTTFPKKGEE